MPCGCPNAFKWHPVAKLGGQGVTSAPRRSVLGRQIEVGMLRNNYEMSNASGYK